MNLTHIFSQIGISQKIAQDVMLIIFVVLVSFVFGMLVGKRRLIPSIIGIYISFSIVSVVPENILKDYSVKLILFLALWAGLTFFGRRFFDVSFGGSGSSFLLKVFSMSFLQIILLLSIVFSFIPKKIALEYISSSAYQYLIESWAPLIWMVLPLVFLIFIYKKNK